MKKIFTLILLAVGFSASAQYVGINTNTPKATLDVVGAPANAARTDGFIPPSLTKAQLVAKTAYGANQAGTLIYITDASGADNAATGNIISAGYYTFNGTQWIGFIPKFRGTHVYKTDNFSRSGAGDSGPITFTNKEYDADNWFNLATGRFQPTVAGYYQINASVKMDDEVPGRKFIDLLKNGSVIYVGTGTPGTIVSSTLSSLVYLNGTTDYLTLAIEFTSNPATTSTNDALQTYFQAYLVSAQ
ncbi:hypothetical protein D3C87_442170 [compost metagenome]